MVFWVSLLYGFTKKEFYNECMERYIVPGAHTTESDVTQRKIAYFFAAAIVMIIIFLVVAVYAYDKDKQPYLAVSFLDVGQGDAIYIEFPGGETMLVDGGPDNSVLHALSGVMPWWKRHIDYVVVTHADTDHYGGLWGVIEKYSIGTVVLSGVSTDDEQFKKFLSDVRSRSLLIREVTAPAIWHFESGPSVEFLWPQKNEMISDDNASSLVMRFVWGEAEYLLAGDIPDAVERRLPALQADVLKIAHHGSKSSSGLEFLQSVNPAYCIISAGQDNQYGHPHPDVINRLKQVGCEIYETATAGTIRFKGDERGLDIFQSSWSWLPL